jgi:hypothetical protein
MTKSARKESPTQNGKPQSNQPIFEELDPIEEISDPFDPAKLRLRGVESLGVKKVLTTVPCSKPNKHQFVRVHFDESYRMETAVFEDRVQGESYLVSPDMWSELSLEVVPVCLFTAITRHNDVFLWPVKLPGADGRSNHWHESALAAARLSIKNWVRISANMPAGRYDVFEASGKLPEPEWPTETFQQLLRRCFENRFIDSSDHPILKSLRGEV